MLFFECERDHETVHVNLGVLFFISSKIAGEQLNARDVYNLHVLFNSLCGEVQSLATDIPESRTILEPQQRKILLGYNES